MTRMMIAMVETLASYDRRWLDDIDVFTKRYEVWLLV